LSLQIGKRGELPLRVEPRFEQVSGDTIIASTSVGGDDARMRERFQVITFRGGKIVDMQGCGSRRAARRFARRAST
jgi:hypothetical protein